MPPTDGIPTPGQIISSSGCGCASIARAGLHAPCTRHPVSAGYTLSSHKRLREAARALIASDLANGRDTINGGTIHGS